ncbi:ATP-binding protein [Streptomyces sp. NPDC046985]|uniref:ATP-binding protein n=1 Tax=Streptomyces sp. NPDC046985 TaxID=3155377 RepID=UPI0033D01CF9
MSIWWSLHLRRDAASVPLARRLLLGAMETAGVDPEISYDLSVALSEACANAVEHGGYADGPRAARTAGRAEHAEDSGHFGDSHDADTFENADCEAYCVTAYLDGETCRIEVTDTGPGFTGAAWRAPVRPAAADAEHGRGLCLIRELADHVHIGNTPDRGGAVVSFDKVLKWRKDPPLMAV